MKWTHRDYIGSVLLGTLLLIPLFICYIPFRLFLDTTTGFITLVIIETIWVLVLSDKFYLLLCKFLKLEERIKMEIEMKKMLKVK